MLGTLTKKLSEIERNGLFYFNSIKYKLLAKNSYGIYIKEFDQLDNENVLEFIIPVDMSYEINVCYILNEYDFRKKHFIELNIGDTIFNKDYNESIIIAGATNNSIRSVTLKNYSLKYLFENDFCTSSYFFNVLKS